jgi:hypothetical protein
MDALTTSDTLTVTRGNQAIGLAKGQKLEVRAVRPLGADYSHFVNVEVRVLSGTGAGRYLTLSTRYETSLHKAALSLGCGDGVNSVKVERA